MVLHSDNDARRVQDIQVGDMPKQTRCCTSGSEQCAIATVTVLDNPFWTSASEIHSIPNIEYFYCGSN